MQMEGLYTFNSQQLQHLIKRPSSTDNPPNIRKRIITTMFYKKPSLLSQASTREHVLTLSKERKLSKNKKVTFLLDSPPLYQEEVKTKMASHLMKTRSLGEKYIQQEFQDDSFSMKLANRYPFTVLESEKEKSQGKLTIFKQDKIVQEEKSIQTSNVGTVRGKRTFSLKLSPKIVPISERRLPRAFNIKYASNSNSKQTSVKYEQKPSQNCQCLKQSQKAIEKFKQIRITKRSRFQGIFQMQRKNFQKQFRQDI